VLPTIRAAQDPITRELYVARAAEWSGVGREVLEREVGRQEARTPGAQPRPRGAPDAPGPEEEGGPGPAPRPAEVPVERTLVRLLLARRDLVARARDAVAASEFRHPWYREIVAALYEGREAPASRDAQALWEELSAVELVEGNVEELLTASIAAMLDRPRQERSAEIDRLIDLAPPAEKDRLLLEKRELAAAREPRFGRKAFKSQREPKY